MSLDTHISDYYSEPGSHKNRELDDEVRLALVEIAFNIGAERFLGLVADAVAAHGDGHRNLLEDDHMETVREDGRSAERARIQAVAAQVENAAEWVRAIGASIDEEAPAPDFYAITLGEFLELHPCRNRGECLAFITALAASPWQFHLDDDPTDDLIGSRAAELKRHGRGLKQRVHQCREILGNDAMWNAYMPDSAEAE